MQNFKKILIVIISIFLYWAVFVCNGLFHPANKIIKESEAELEHTGGKLFVSLQYEASPLKLGDIEETNLKYQEFFNMLAQSPYEYYEYYEQPLYYVDGVSSFFDNISLVLQTSGNGIPCAQVDMNFFKKFDFQLLEGKYFSQEDYQFNAGEYIPVILGAHYSEIYSLGDSFDLEYLYHVYKFQVVGFLDEGSYFYRNYGYTDFDDYIIMPSFCFRYEAKDENELVSQLLHNASRTSGFFHIDEADYLEFEEYIDAKIDCVGLGEYSWYTNSLVLEFQSAGQDLVMMRAIAATLGSLAFLLVTFLILSYSTRQKKDFISIAIIYFISVLFALILSKLVLNPILLQFNLTNDLYNGIYIIVVALITCIATCVWAHKNITSKSGL